MVPALTNIFMGYQETKWLKGCNLNKPKLYLIYFDGILAACDKEKDSLDFFIRFLHKKHCNIKFMIEKQVNHSISFLDGFIPDIDNQNLTLQAYQ